MEDETRLKEWYIEAKVYFDGSHYVAIPHTENHAKRRKRHHEQITVSEQDGKLKLEKAPVKDDMHPKSWTNFWRCIFYVKKKRI